MRCRWTISCLILGMMSSMLGSGCAIRDTPPMTWRMGDSQKLLAKQPAGMSVADEARQTLPEMTAQEYEAVGDNYVLQNNLPMAFVQYDKALQMAPSTMSLRYKKGLLFLKRGLAQEALRAFQDVLHTDDTFALAHEGIGQAFLLTGDIRQAETHLQRAIALDASLWKSYNVLGMMYDHQQRFDAAIASYNAAMALKKNDGSLLNNVGVSYARKGDHDNALRAFEKALHLGYADAKVYNNLGLSLAKLGRYQEALLAFTRGGDKAKAYNNLGVVYVSEGKYKEAVAAFEKALELHPRYYTTASENLRLAQQALRASPPSPHVLSSAPAEPGAQAAR